MTFFYLGLFFEKAFVVCTFIMFVGIILLFLEQGVKICTLCTYQLFSKWTNCEELILKFPVETGIAKMCIFSVNITILYWFKSLFEINFQKESVINFPWFFICWIMLYFKAHWFIDHAISHKFRRATGVILTLIEFSITSKFTVFL